MAATQPASAPLTVRNTGSRRVVLGPVAKSQGGLGRPVLLGTEADGAASIPADRRVAASTTLTGAAAEHFRGSKVLEAVQDRLGIQAA